MDGFNMSFNKFLEGLHKGGTLQLTKQMPSCVRGTLHTINAYTLKKALI